MIIHFRGVEKQFRNLMNTENVNERTIETFADHFEKQSNTMASLKFKISRINSDLLNNSPELQDLIRYCSEEMVVQEAEHCLSELGRIQHAEYQRLLHEEKLRRQDEEQKRQEENKTLERSKDGRFIVYKDGTVLDNKTELMWASKGNGEPIDWHNAKPYCEDLSQRIDWHNAKRYCENYRGGGYTDWRMPTIAELKELYDTGCYEVAVYTLCNSPPQLIKVFITPFIQLTATTWVWASNLDEGQAAIFDFNMGEGIFARLSGDFGQHALPVRHSIN